MFRLNSTRKIIEGAIKNLSSTTRCMSAAALPQPIITPDVKVSNTQLRKKSLAAFLYLCKNLHAVFDINIYMLEAYATADKCSVLQCHVSYV